MIDFTLTEIKEIMRNYNYDYADIPTKLIILETVERLVSKFEAESIKKIKEYEQRSKHAKQT